MEDPNLFTPTFGLDESDLPKQEDPETIPMLTRSAAREQREAEAQGVVISLPYTRGKARVRIPVVEEVIAGGWLPAKQRSTLGDMLVENSKGSAPKDGRDRFRAIEETVKSELDLADAIVCHSFLDPEVVASEDKLDPDRDDQIVVTDLHERDRRAFLIKIVRDQRVGDVKIIHSFRS